MVKSIGLVILCAVAVAIVTMLAYRAYRQSANRATLNIESLKGVQESMFLKVGGIDQFISIRGEDSANPVLLVLHGGMATSYISFTPFFRKWEQHFTVVQWDRRGVGKTYGRHGRRGAGEMSLDRIVNDGIEVAEYLREHLGKDRVVLLGHSMGSMIGITMASRRPDLFSAYVGTEQIVDMATNELVSYRLMLERVRGSDHRKAIERLERIGEPPYARLRDWGSKQQTAEIADPAYGAIAQGMLSLLLFAPEYSLRDVFDFVVGQMFCGSTLYQEWMGFDARRLGASFSTPIFIIQGKEDVMTPTALVTAWLENIDAPHKEFIPIDGGGHLVMVTAPDEYFAALIETVRPAVMLR
jgi:pimeloyl-ACP methyl ester carboxylesterase